MYIFNFQILDHADIYVYLYIYIFNFQILDHADKWGVDMFRIAEITDNKTLTCVTYTIFQVYRRHLFQNLHNYRIFKSHQPPPPFRKYAFGKMK